MAPANLSLGLRNWRDAHAAPLPRAIVTKNKTPAPVQITAEQILRDAREMLQDEPPPKIQLVDHDELADHRSRRREKLEARVRRARWDAAAWAKYARWEESQGDLARARSVWERALDAGGHRDAALWVGYAEFESRRGCVAHARNVWDRAVAVLPRVDRLWYDYALMEELLGNYAGARQVFERWTEWCPAVEAWAAYAEFELRYGECDRARAVFERLVLCQPGDTSAWMRYAEFETKHGGVDRTRACYERAAEAVPAEEEGAEGLLAAFAEFEEWCGETDRARCVYRYALGQVRAGGAAEDLRREYAAFERRCRDRGDSVSSRDGFLGGTESNTGMS